MSTGPMSRRHFLAVIAGTTGAAAAAGLGGWRLLGSRGSSLPAAASFAADPGVEIVEVQPGFVDATVWNDELLTLRASPTGTGIMLRSETADTDHPVDAPEGFAARCVGVIDNTIIIGGHREYEIRRVVFQAGEDYGTLLRQAGDEADLLLTQPGRPAAHAHERSIVPKIATVAVAEAFDDWSSRELSFPEGTGGSIAAVLETSSDLALDHYRFPDLADSNFEAALIDGRAALVGTGEFRAWSQPVDHGSIVNSASAPGIDLIVISDRHGTRCFDQNGSPVFDFDDALVHSVQPLSDDLADITAVGALTHEGRIETRFFRGGSEYAPAAPALLMTHQASAGVTLAAPAGLLPAALVPES